MEIRQMEIQAEKEMNKSTLRLSKLAYWRNIAHQADEQRLQADVGSSKIRICVECGGEFHKSQMLSGTCDECIGKQLNF